jgi:hypothetical protein
MSRFILMVPGESEGVRHGIVIRAMHFKSDGGFVVHVQDAIPPILGNTKG